MLQSQFLYISFIFIITKILLTATYSSKMKFSGIYKTEKWGKKQIFVLYFYFSLLRTVTKTLNWNIKLDREESRIGGDTN